MENTENLNLPYIMPSQAQKHVTHNEAIRQLDALVQLSVVSMDFTEPPSSPEAGARYIIGPEPSGSWAGLGGQVAAYLDGSWTIFQPVDGWLAYVEDQNIVVVNSNATWQELPSPKTLSNMEGVGVGAEPDAENKLAVAADASLFSNAGNSHRLKVNKAEETETASVIFQSGWTGHAEFGLTGTNDFQVKVSDDGSNFQTAMQINKATGMVQFPLGAETLYRIDLSGLWALWDGLGWVGFNEGSGANQGIFNGRYGTAAEPSYSCIQNGPVLRKGSRIRSFLIAMRSMTTDLNGYNLRLVFRYGPADQEWTDSNIESEELFSANNIAVSSTYFSGIEEIICNYECKHDGFLLMFVQPIGSYSLSNSFVASTSVEIISSWS